MQQNPDPNVNQPNPNISHVSDVSRFAAPSSTSFTNPEWQTLVGTPLKVCAAMIAVSPSNIIGQMQEGKAMKKSLEKLQQRSTTSPMMNELSRNLNDMQKTAEASRKNVLDEMHQAMQKPDAIKADALTSCQQAVSILTKASPQDANDYKQAVYSCARDVAEAAREGGVFGVVGGAKISSAEQNLLNDLAKTLGIPHA